MIEMNKTFIITPNWAVPASIDGHCINEARLPVIDSVEGEAKQATTTIGCTHIAHQCVCAIGAPPRHAPPHSLRCALKQSFGLPQYHTVRTVVVVDL